MRALQEATLLRSENATTHETSVVYTLITRVISICSVYLHFTFTQSLNISMVVSSYILVYDIDEHLPV